MTHVSTSSAGAVRMLTLTSILLLGFANPAQLTAQLQVGPFNGFEPTFLSYSVPPRATVLSRDGHLDLVFPVLYRNPPGILGGGPLIHRFDQSGRFTELGCVLSGHPANTAYDSGTLTVAVGDVNGDGWTDVVAPQFWGQLGTLLYPPMVFLNDQNGTPRYHPNSGLDSFLLRSSGAELFDADGDGDLDLYIFTRPGHPDHLFLNDGTGHFTDVTTTHLPALFDETLWIKPVDLDLDGDIDLVVGINHLPALVLHNDGQGRFITAQQIPGAISVTSIAAGDLDGDGYPDLYLGTRFGPGDVLLRNDGSGRFIDMSYALLNFSIRSWTPSVLFHDMDHDGRLDIVVIGPMSSTAPWPTVWRNDGAWTFTDITRQIHQTNVPITTHHWIVLADVEGDGDLDFIVCYQEPVPGIPGHRAGGRILYNLTRHIEAPATTPRGSLFMATAHARDGHLLFPFLGLTRSDNLIPGIGRFGLDPSAVLSLPPVPIGASGNAQFGFPIPNDPALRNVDFYLQLLDIGSNPIAVTPTGWSKTRIQ